MRTVFISLLLAGCSEFDVTAKSDDPTAPVDTAVEVVPGALQVTPPVIDFGEVAIGASANDTLVLTNAGGSPLIVTAAGVVDDAGMFSAEVEIPLELAAGESHEVPVAFAPTRGGEFVGDAWFESDVEGTGTERATLLGHTPDPDIEISPTLHDFGAVGVDTVHTVTVTVANVGGGPLDITGVEYASTDDTVLYLSDDGALGGTLGPGERRELEVTFAPTTLGGWEGTLTVASDDPDEAEVIAVQSGLATCACPDGWVPSGDNTRCLRREEVPALFVGEPVEVCSIEPYFAYGMQGALYPDGFRAQDAFWGQNDGVPNGRLNEVGIWGCIPGTEVAGHDPVGEWVGFQMCLELEETGTYVTGMGADNRFRLVVDGVTMWEEDTGTTAAFNYWWMIPMELEAGEHIVQLWGKNDGSIAGLGVEIYGPFDPALVTDGASTHALPLADNTVWSTRDAVGHSFDVGTDAGWYCPEEGMVLDFCEEEPTCIIDLEMECP